MPRDGSGIYHRPPGTDAVTDTSIESTKYNINVADVEQDLNAPRPIIAGGTGANNAHDAMVALSGEITNQVVDNYDTFPFVSGSFSSAPNVTGGPPMVGTYFVGICYREVSGTQMVLEARQQMPTPTENGRLFVRQKWGTTWGPWHEHSSGDLTALDNRYVNVSGDTMSGPLVINSGPTWEGISINQTSSNDNAGISFNANGHVAGIYGLRTGGLLFRGDAAVSLGNLNGNGDLYLKSNIVLQAGTTNAGGVYFCDPNLTPRSLTFSNGFFAFTGGDVWSDNSIHATGNLTAKQYVQAGSAGGAGRYHFGNAGTHYLDYDGGVNYTLQNGVLTINSNTTSYEVLTLSQPNPGNWSGVSLQTTDGNAQLYAQGNGGFMFRVNSVVQASLGNSGNFYINGHGFQPGGGSWGDSSDARIKNELGDYTRGLEEIIALRPIYYTFKGNDTPVEPSHEKTGDPEKDAKLAEIPLTVPYPNSTHGGVAKAGTKYTGLIAQEVETVFPEMVTKRSAFIDGVAVDDLRDLNTTPLIFALVNAVKELAARVEELEARQPARR